MRALRPQLAEADLAVPILGAAATVLAAYVSVRTGAEISVGALLVVALFVGSVIGFVAYPHIAVAATVVVFTLLPTLKVFVSPEIGAVKDLIVLAAVLAAVILLAFDRRWIDAPTLILVLLVLGFYVLNPGGGHGIEWAQGLRLAAEPLLLLLVGLALPDPRRTFRWALGALIAACCLVAAYGMFQQLVGKFALVDWGYSFDAQVRSLPSGQLRSFGTLDDPFAYTALLSFGMVAVLFWLRRGPVAWATGLLILVGLGLGLVRTTLLVLVAFGGLLLRRWEYHTSAILLVAATVVAGIVILGNAGGTQAQTYMITNSAGGAGSSANVILNGRISAWEAALGDDPGDWLLGQGVGEVGTAAARASYSIAPPSESSDSTQAEAVDSGYLATIADIGLIGLAVLLALFVRLIVLASDATRRNISAGWVALGLLTALLLDALTRASLTGFPTAFLGLLLVGIALAAAHEESEAPAARTPAPAD